MFPHTHTQLDPNQLPSLTSPQPLIPIFYLSRGEEVGREAHQGDPAQGQVLDLPPFPVSVFSLPHRGPERDQPGQWKAAFELILGAVSSPNTLKDAFPFHTPRSEEKRRPVNPRPEQQQGKEASLPFPLHHPSLQALRTTLYSWPPHQLVPPPFIGGGELQYGKAQTL